jgi:hypothetical protein
MAVRSGAGPESRRECRVHAEAKVRSASRATPFFVQRVSELPGARHAENQEKGDELEMEIR